MMQVLDVYYFGESHEYGTDRETAIHKVIELVWRYVAFINILASSSSGSSTNSFTAFISQDKPSTVSEWE